MLNLTTSDNQKVEVTQDFKAMSRLIENALADNDAAESVDVTLPGVELAQLKLIIEYAEHHSHSKAKSDICRPLKTKVAETSIPDAWEREWIAKITDRNAKTALLLASNKIECDALFGLCAASLALEFKYADWNGVRSKFGLDSVEYLPEEPCKLAAEAGWVFGPAEKKIQELIDKKMAAGEKLEGK